MSKQKNVVIISASPKIGEDTVSGALADMAKNQFSDDVSVSMVDVRKSFSGRQNDKNFDIMLEADALIFIFPLYIFCLPGILMRFLQDYALYRQQHPNPRSPKVYAAVNCGFPEAWINEEAVRVIKSFSKHIGARFRFGILIGGGGMLLGTKDAPFMKKTLAKISEAFRNVAVDIADGEVPQKDFYIEMNFPSKLYLFMGNMGWKQLAKRYGLKKKDLYARPYMQ